MVASSHFMRLSQQLYNLLQDGCLIDATIQTSDKPVVLHKIILLIFSSHLRNTHEEKNEKSEIKASTFSSADVQDLVEFLYNGNATVSSKVVELVKTLQLDLSVDQHTRRKKIQKGESFQKMIGLEMKYLRNLTFEIEIPKLLKPPRMFSDVCIVTGCDQHKCHKIILSAASLYFKVMFSSGMKEAQTDMIHLQGVESDIFIQVLSYVYTGSIAVTVNNAQDLLATSVYLQMEMMQTMCEDFLLQQMDINNCIDMWSLATAYNCPTLLDGAWTFIVNHFDKIPKLALLKGLKHGDVLRLLKDDNLCVNEEIDVLKFTIDWISRNKASEKLADLIGAVRMTLIELPKLEEIVEQNSEIKKDKDCKEPIQKVIQQMKEGQLEGIADAKPRKEKVFLVIKRSSYASGMEAGCYSLAQKKWFRLQHYTLCEGGTGYASCVGKGSIYVTGGTATPCNTFQFSVDENKWSELPEMRDERTSHGAAYVNNFIYVFGGSDISKGAFNIVPTIEKYDTVHRVWKTIGQMEIPTYDSAYAVCKSRIYVFGGAISLMSGVYIKDIQCIDTVSETCSVLYHNLPFTLSLGVACSYNRKMYINCPNGKIIQYNEDDTPVIISNTKGSQLMGFATLYNEDAVYILGGYSMVGESDTIHKFDLKTLKETQYATKLPFKRQSNQLFATVMHVSRKFLVSDYDADKTKATNWFH